MLTNLCHRGCGRVATFTTKKSISLCSEHPAQCPAVLAKMRSTNIIRHGVENASSLDIVKKIRKEKAIAKYGVSNVSKAPEVKQLIGSKARERWNQTTQHLVDDHKTSPHCLSKKEYGKMVKKITEWMYKEHCATIDPQRLRGKEWHLDHRVSILHGFVNNIPPHIIGDVSNLAVIPKAANVSKRHRNSQTVQSLYEAHNAFYNGAAPAPINEILAAPSHKPKMTFRDDIGKCQTCGNAAQFMTASGKWCCSDSRNKCPAMKRKNSINQKTSEKKRRSTKEKMDRHGVR